ncbi:NAD-dependent epimerase/dehydratase family protein [Rubritepida flocculans]|uniref:NAD-dependent epimerase/dehydratase family protein n=1 Tax=Rubritepida flocculans TaxID=182403 RepID=UPI000684A72F|nr:NAD-dependent epimerase/dehydratase family protein [Rubritepida flocculans]
MRVLVTGGHGFIGRAACARLAAGHSVRAASRRSGLDVTRPETLPPALAGVEAVVHAAVEGRASIVEGTANLLAAARAAGVRRFVHLSSVAVYGAAEGAVREDTPRAPGDSAYGRWKAEAEALVEAVTDFEVVILRPALVYGPGDPLWIGRMARRLALGALGPLGAAGEGLADLVHVRDVAEAIALALTGPPGLYNLGGPAPVTWNEYLARLAAGLGLAPRPLSPAELAWRARLALPVKALARALPPLAPLLPAALRESPGAGELALFRRRARYPWEKAEAALGWAPRIGLDEGLAESLAALRPRE